MLAKRRPDEPPQQDQARDQTAVLQHGPSALIHIVRVDRKADVGKQRRQVDRRVDRDQSPVRSAGSLRTDDVQKEQQDDRPDGIPVDIDGPSQHDPGRAKRQQIVQIVLDDQAEHQRADDEQDLLLPLLNVGIDPHGDEQSNQQKDRRQDGEGLQIANVDKPIQGFTHGFAPPYTLGALTGPNCFMLLRNG